MWRLLRSFLYLAGLVAGLVAAAGCSLLVDTSGLTGGPKTGENGGDGGAADAGEPGPAGTTDAGGEAGPALDPFCPYPHGMSHAAPWPTRGGCVMRNGRGRAVGPKAAKPRHWKIDVPDPGAASSSIFGQAQVGPGDLLLVGVEDNGFGVRAFGLDGQVKWKAATLNANAVSVAADGSLVANAGPGATHIDAASGAVFWHATVDDEVDSALAIGTNGDIYYATFSHRTGGAITKDGALRWSLDFGQHDERVWSAALGPTDVVYFTDGYGFVVGFDPKDGTKVFNQAVGSAVGDNASIGDDGTIYVGTFQSDVVAFQPTGVEKWRTSLDADSIWTPTLGPDGAVYASTVDGTLVALDAAGKERWRTKYPKAIIGQPLLDAAGDLFVVTEEPAIHGVDPGGNVLWNAGLPDLPADGLAMASTGALIVTLRKGGVHIFDP